MTDFSIIQFEREFESQVTLVKSSPWLVIKLKILNSLYSTIHQQLSAGQGKSYLTELDQLSVNVLRKAGLNEYSGIAPDLLDQSLERLQAQGPGSIRLEGINLISGLCCICFRLDESARILKTLQKYNLYDGPDLKVDRQMSVEDFIPLVANHIPAVVRKALETELSNRQSTSSGDSLWGLFVVGAADYTAGIVGRMKLMNVRLSKRLGTDQVRVASHLVDESDIIADQTRAVCRLLKQKYGVSTEQAIRLDYSIDQPAAVLVGNSIGLGLALLGSMGLHMYRHNRALEYRIYDDVAFTGAVDRTGQVQPVVEQAIKAKLKAAFFSAVNSVVLPVQQFEVAQAVLRKLNSQYPHRQLNLIPAESLPVLEQRREVIYLQRRRAVKRLGQFVREYANSVTLMILGFIVLAAVGLWFGVVKHPVPHEIDKQGNSLVLKNKFGFDLWSAGEGSFLGNISDLNNDGEEEILISYKPEPGLEFSGMLVCYDKKGLKLWSIESGYEVSYGGNIYRNYFKVIGMIIDDFNGDGFKEIVAISFSGFFPTRVFTINNDGILISEYWHSGGLEQGIVIDIYPGNDTKELIIPGRNNEYRTGIIVVLDPFLMEGCSPQKSDQYSKENCIPGNEIYYLRFPKTHFWEPSLSDYTLLMDLNYENQIKAANFHQILLPNGYERIVGVIYEFNNSLALLSYSLGDDYNLFRDQISNSDQSIYSLINQSLIELNKIEYWNGNKWMFSPKINIVESP